MEIYSGTEEFSDLFNLYPVVYDSNIDAKFIYSANHNVMKFLDDRNQLTEIVISFIEGRKSNSMLPQINFLEHQNVFGKLCDFVRGFYFNDTDLRTLDLILEKLLSYFPRWSAIHHYRGQLYAKHGKYIDAVKHFESALETVDDNHEIFGNLGSSAILGGEYKKAELAFAKANSLLLSPSPKYMSKLGAAIMLQGRNDEAVAIQQRVVEIARNYSPAYYQLGLLMNKKNRYVEAISFFEKALELGDKNPNLKKHLNTARKKSF